MSVNRLLLFLLLLYVPEVLRPNCDQIFTLKFYETLWFVNREPRGGEPDPLKKRLLFV